MSGYKLNQCVNKETCTLLAVDFANHRIKELESQLEQAKKDQARYKFVRDMSAEDFGNLSTINELFDCAIDAAMQENQQ
jgi:hypothetical protein